MLPGGQAPRQSAKPAVSWHRHRHSSETCYLVSFDVQIDTNCTNLKIEPKAGRVPGTNDPARLAAPSATSSRFGLIGWPKRSPFCFAATMLSKNPMTVTRLSNSIVSSEVHIQRKNLHRSGCCAAQKRVRVRAQRKLEEMFAGRYRDRTENRDAILVPMQLIGYPYKAC